jgi:hypothetical protein
MVEQQVSSSSTGQSAEMPEGWQWLKASIGLDMSKDNCLLSE